MFNFTPLLGAQSDSPASQSLLELDGGVKILVDVGWDETFDAETLHAIEQHVSTLSIILLTHPTLDHIGAYAHCCKHIAGFSRVPVYATTPVVNLGRTLLADLYTSAPLTTSIIPTSAISSSPIAVDPSTAPSLLYQHPTPDDIAAYCNAIHPLKYSQPHQPIGVATGPGLGNLVITAYSAGHTPGGTIWHIQHGLESIVYAADWNQGRENLLSGAAWLGTSSDVIEPLRRPTALVCSSKGVQKTGSLPRTKRDELLFSLIRETVAQGGKVLIPTDSSARVLELAFILNHTWRENITGPHADTYRHARIFMASKSSTSTMRQLHGMLEWMDDAIIRDAEAAMGPGGDDKKVPNLLDWKFVKQIERKSQLDKVLQRQNPCIILASDASLEWGLSQHALKALAGDARNLVILTENLTSSNPRTASIAKSLAELYRENADQPSKSSVAKVVSADGHSVLLREPSASALTEDDNTLYQQYQARQRQLHSNLQGDNTANDTATTEIAQEEAEESSDEEDEEEEEDPDRQGRALNLTAQINQGNKRKAGVSEAELGINVLLRSKNVYDYDVRHKRGREKMFPFVSHRNKDDEYGDLIKPEDYLRAEERDDTGNEDTRDGLKPEASELGQKRKWNDVADAKAATGRGRKDRKQEQNKKQKTEPDDIDAIIAKATGESGSGQNTVNGAPEDEDDSESDYEPDEGDSDEPKKVIFNNQTISLHIRIGHIDFTGMHEKRDLQNIIPRVRPRKLILISGDVSETQFLADWCRQSLGSEAGESASEVFAPIIGETVDASVDTNAWTLKLSRQLVKKLTWQNVKGLGIVTLTGSLVAERVEEAEDAEDENVKKKLKLIKGEDTEDLTMKDETAQVMPVLDLVKAPAGATQTRGAQPVHVGDLRIAEFRRMLTESGHVAEFRGQGSKPNPIFTMPAYPFMPMYGAPMPGAWAPPYPGNPYGPVFAAPPAKSAKAPSTAPPKPPPVPSTVHPSVAKLRSVKCGESSPGGNRVISIEEWQKFCNAADDRAKQEQAKAAKSVNTADFGSDFAAFIEWNRLRKEAKVAATKPASTKAKSEKSAAHSHNSYAPPTIRPGVNYLFPEKTQHTMLHVFAKTSKLWEDKYKGTVQKFKIFKASTNFPVAEIMERVRGGKEKCEGWAVTEVVEAGSGGWKKGTTIAYGDEKAKGSLESMGWDQTRGCEGRPPVWLVVHNA
ncbi:Cleavage and polyadenylation specificity factor subunit 2 [Fulvia fulva]|nr:Cleavage and polyadenylation specificity factor subunit 2 [Fulvia fulva]KAK4614401.1 Cleavage and polyadenylation specificity factor subunit 2 [Fulvia fulva]WPV20429.1 Cleavage and polyadenylation specificity factor subunit 2 [Fulvia fulva]WPV35464.1 Cleavage and polyadenylation specificity factor subunit 2 [Fulvia fulva]